MNVLLWILQGLLALLYLAGGAFKTLKPDDVAKQITSLPVPAWRVVGVVEVLGAVLLVLPMAVGWRPDLTPIAAAALAVETLALAGVYGWHSLKLTPANPLVFAVPMLVGAMLVAAGRFLLVGPGA